MIEFNLDSRSAGEEHPDFAVSVIGIGGAGANVIDRISLDGMPGADLICMNCDVRALTTSMAGRKVQLGRNLTQGLGCGGDPDLGQEAALSSSQEIRELLTGRHMVFLSVGLGGGTGSGAAPYVARMAREAGAFVVVFATLPFSFEGRRRTKQAAAALTELRRHANALVTFENDRIGELVLPKKGVQEAFEVADRIIGQSVRAVTSLVTQPGLIRIGMDELITALRNTDSRCLFGFGQAKGENRATEALSLALKSPLLDRGQMLSSARNVLVHICGGANVTLFEIETLMRELSKHVNEDAQILFGAATDPKLNEHLSVTLISSLNRAPAIGEEAAEAPRSEPEPLLPAPGSPEFLAAALQRPTAPVPAPEPPAPANVMAAPVSAPPVAAPVAAAPEPALRAPAPATVPVAVPVPEPVAVAAAPEPEPVAAPVAIAPVVVAAAAVAAPEPTPVAPPAPVAEEPPVRIESMAPPVAESRPRVKVPAEPAPKEEASDPLPTLRVTNRPRGHTSPVPAPLSSPAVVPVEPAQTQQPDLFAEDEAIAPPPPRARKAGIQVLPGTNGGNGSRQARRPVPLPEPEPEVEEQAFAGDDEEDESDLALHAGAPMDDFHPAALEEEIAEDLMDVTPEAEAAPVADAGLDEEEEDELVATVAPEPIAEDVWEESEPADDIEAPAEPEEFLAPEAIEEIEPETEPEPVAEIEPEPEPEPEPVAEVAPEPVPVRTERLAPPAPAAPGNGEPSRKSILRDIIRREGHVTQPPPDFHPPVMPAKPPKPTSPVTPIPMHAPVPAQKIAEVFKEVSAPARPLPPASSPRVPDMDRVVPIRPIPVQKAGEPKRVVNSPFHAARNQAPAQPPGGTRQETFDERLQPQARGRFERVEPTVEAGEDLDVPTFLRKKR